MGFSKVGSVEGAEWGEGVIIGGKGEGLTVVLSGVRGYFRL